MKAYKRIILGIAALSVVTVLIYINFNGSQVLQGPAEVIWDKQACDYCKMHIGDPSFAAQLQLTDGRTFFFDDSGCLIKFHEQRAYELHQIYFHHHQEDRWLSLQQVAFTPVAHSPMGYKLGAVDKTEAHTFSLDEAKARILKAAQP